MCIWKISKKKNSISFADALNRIAKEEGISALWSGIRTSFLLSGNPAIQFMAYESIKRFFNRIKTASDGKIKAISVFVISALSVTYP